MWFRFLIFIAVLNVTTGGFMWFAPETWYAFTPGVAMMGPFNAHFIRDVALAFLISGAAVLWGVWRTDTTAIVFGTGWPCFHAIFHATIWLNRGMPLDDVAFVNLVGIQLPAWLAFVAALRSRNRTGHS